MAVFCNAPGIDKVYSLLEYRCQKSFQDGRGEGGSFGIRQFTSIFHIYPVNAAAARSMAILPIRSQRLK